MRNLFDVLEEEETSTKPRNLFKATEKEGLVEGFIKPTLDDVADIGKGTVETIASLASSLALWPVSKSAGVWELMKGGSAEQAKQAEEQFAGYAYQPESESGKGASELVGKGFDLALTPARMAGEGVTELVGPRAGYIAELGAELAMFKMAHGAGGKGKAYTRQRATSKQVLNKKLSELTKQERIEVNKIAEVKI